MENGYVVDSRIDRIENGLFVKWLI